MDGRVKVVGQVERVDGRSLTYTEFVDRFMAPNRPVVLTGLTASWRSCEDWTLPGSGDRRRPNLGFFASNFPSPLVPVADCSSREFTDQKRLEMSMQEFVDRWVGNSADRDDSLLYLKDWHFVKEYPEYVAYTTPTFFADDWLNMYLDSHPIHRDSDIANHKNEVNCADYRFVYMGAKGTWTPLHADVFRSYSWSANVCGRKLWLFLSPSQSHCIFDRNMRSSVYSLNDVVSEKQFPEFKKTEWLECIQEQNEIIFVPSGWYHQVHNLMLKSIRGLRSRCSSRDAQANKQPLGACRIKSACSCFPSPARLLPLSPLRTAVMFTFPAPHDACVCKIVNSCWSLTMHMTVLLCPSMPKQQNKSHFRFLHCSNVSAGGDLLFFRKFL